MIRDSVWFERADAKYGEVYLSGYIAAARKRARAFRVVVLLFSGSDVFGWPIWEPIAWIACLFIAVIQLLALIEKHIIISDEELGKIGDLRNLYISYLHKLEEIWVDLEADRITDEMAKKKFFNLKGTAKQEIENLDNQLNIDGTIGRLLDYADEEHRKYLINRYGKN